MLTRLEKTSAERAGQDDSFFAGGGSGMKLPLTTQSLGQAMDYFGAETSMFPDHFWQVVRRSTAITLLFTRYCLPHLLGHFDLARASPKRAFCRGPTLSPPISSREASASDCRCRRGCCEESEVPALWRLLALVRLRWLRPSLRVPKKTGRRFSFHARLEHV